MEETKKVEQTKTKDVAEKKVKHRSPNYPAIPLERALAFTQTLYDKFKQSVVAFEVAAKGINYSHTSSVGLQIMAAISYYGLINIEGMGKLKRVKISDLAFKIIMDKRAISPERDAGLKQAALSPSIFKKIKNDFPDNVPADEALEYDLVMKYKFNPATVRELIKVFKKTMDYAKVYESDIIEAEGGDNSEEDVFKEEGDIKMEKVLPSGQSKPPILLSLPMGEREIANYPIKGGTIRLLASGSITQKAIEKLIKLLEISKEDFPENDIKEDTPKE